MTIRLHRTKSTDDSEAAYYADTPSGRINFVPCYTETGRVEGWISIRADDKDSCGTMHRTLADAREWIGRQS